MTLTTMIIKRSWIGFSAHRARVRYRDNVTHALGPCFVFNALRVGLIRPAAQPLALPLHYVLGFDVHRTTVFGAAQPTAATAQAKSNYA